MDKRGWAFVEKKNTKIQDKKKSSIEEILGVVSFLVFIAACAFLASSKISIEFFILITIAIFINFCIRPFIIYKNEVIDRKVEINSIYILRPCFVAAVALGSIFIIYKVIFSQSIIREKNYTAYNFIALCIIFSMVAIQIVNFINRIKALVNENANFMKHLLNVITSILSILTLVIIPASRFFVPKKVVDFSNVKMPNEFFIYEVSDCKPKDMNYAFSDKAKVSDNKLIELFQKELCETKSENIRDLDKINYDIRNIKGEYVKIQPSYINTSYGNRWLHGIDEGYIYEIRIHKNGDIVLADFDIDKYKYHIFFKKPYDIYRLNLSKKFVYKLMSLIKQ